MTTYFYGVCECGLFYKLPRDDTFTGRCTRGHVLHEAPSRSVWLFAASGGSPEAWKASEHLLRDDTSVIVTELSRDNPGDTVNPAKSPTE